MRTIALLIALALTGAASAAERYAGRAVVDVLRDLESRGLQLVYSETIVPRDLIVQREPEATTPRAILDEILAPHSLRATAGPSGVLLIVRVSEDAPAEKIEVPMMLEEIVVIPSRFEILSSDPDPRQFLSREEVRSVPHLADDLYRAIGRIPGTAGSEVTARPNIRGGVDDEILVVIDGAEIYDPFHLKDLFRAFSTIDAEAIGAVDIMTGGFPSEYGGRMSGVVHIDTLAPQSLATELGISLLNMRAMSQGKFAKDRGEWLVSFRRGYLEDVLEYVDDTSTIDPTYYDLLGKLQWSFGSNALVSAHVLASRDRLSVDEFSERAEAEYEDSYLWLNARGTPRPRLFLQSVASLARLHTRRAGAYGGEIFLESGRAADDRSGQVIALKNDVSFDMSDRNVIKGGITFRSTESDFRYSGSSEMRFLPMVPGGPTGPVSRSADLQFEGTEVAGYVADRMRVSESVVVEGGLRFQTETHTPDGWSVDPRLNLAWLLSPRTSLRVAWGRFSQPQAIFELAVEDGETEFSPAQHATHQVVGVEHSFSSDVTARVELYVKQFSQLRARYENIYDRIILFPELRYDRVRVDAESARARGAEFLVRWNRTQRPLSGWVSYSRAEVTDHVDGRDVPRAWDQRNAFSFSVNYRRGTAWNFNVAGTYHSGWPLTPVSARIEDGEIIAEAGPRNSERLPAYRRVDFRASRDFAVGEDDVISVFVELFNMFSQTNAVRVGGFEYETNGERVDVRPLTESIIGILPSFGVSWRF